jgi:hypothetical protein
MTLRFKTDSRWWFCISLVLFVLSWFLPVWDLKGAPSTPPWVLWVSLFADSGPDHLGWTLRHLGMFSLFFAFPAVAVGWVLHCVAVIVRDARKHRGQDAG